VTFTSAQCLNLRCAYCTDVRCSHACHNPEGDASQPSLFDPAPGMADPAAAFNATGSPTGRITRRAPATSVNAAIRSGAGTQRQKVYDQLASVASATSIELARMLPEMKVSNRVSSRLGELWEEGRAAVLREHGCCQLGSCHPHAKPAIIHRPQDACPAHGRPRTRGGAAVWVAL
jgi:hypothetical protein